MDNETIACCQLGRVFGFNPKLGRKLMEKAGSALNVFSMRPADIRALTGADSPPGLDRAGFDASAKELERGLPADCYFLGISSGSYPWRLKECEDAPLGLYIKSKSSPEEIFKEKPFIAVVGTRDLSHYGQNWCTRITAAICRTKERPTIVSGLALGTDITAHSTALDCGAPTIAVMATGIDSVYPRVHSYEADRIAEFPGGALVTDYPPGTTPVATNFLRRNRIIAGLSDATIITESHIKGGGLLTCNMAFYYNRDVYALPGRADDIRSAGCNKLIFDNKAELIFSEEDLVKKLGLRPRKDIGSICEGPDALPPVLSSEDRADAERILGQIKRQRQVTKEELSRQTGLDSIRTGNITLLLEAEGLIYTDILGNCYARDKT